MRREEKKKGKLKLKLKGVRVQLYPSYALFLLIEYVQFVP